MAPARIGDYLRDVRGLLDKHGYRCALYGHFGQGCVHTRIDFDLTSAGGIARYRNFIEEAADLVVRYGGSFSGEHGDGQARAELLPKMYGPELVAAFREFKHIWDPRGRMNPGKLVDPDRLDENLRLGAGFVPARPVTHFRFPEDEGSFGRAALRCVGVGKCRRDEGGTMCPSYMVTREELHTTRGRAHALFEMLQGGVLDQGWRDEHVMEALDLCLSCKGCKSDCPVNVDVATYKAEFLSHYYRGKLRPRAAYSMGLIMVWARLAALAPGIANRVIRAPGLGRLLEVAGGIAPERELPPFAPRTFRSWFFMLTLAKRFLRRILDDLRPLLAVGVPVVGLEPSCISVFRDELPNLFPDDPDARRLSRSARTLAEFLRDEAGAYRLPSLAGAAVVHGHCHHKSIMKMEADARVLDAIGLDYEVLDAGCCGMAGSFGYEAEHYDVSRKCGERVLLPEVRKAADRELVVADGFSCRSQIEDGTPRRALHLAEVLYLAKTHGPQAPGGRPEQVLQTLRAKLLEPPRQSRRVLLAATVALGIASLLLARRRPAPRLVRRLTRRLAGASVRLGTR